MTWKDVSQGQSQSAHSCFSYCGVVRMRWSGYVHTDGRQTIAALWFVSSVRRADKCVKYRVVDDKNRPASIRKYLKMQLNCHVAEVKVRDKSAAVLGRFRSCRRSAGDSVRVGTTFDIFDSFSEMLSNWFKKYMYKNESCWLHICGLSNIL